MVRTKPIPERLWKASGSSRFIGKGNWREISGNRNGNTATDSENSARLLVLFLETGIVGNQVAKSDERRYWVPETILPSLPIWSEKGKEKAEVKPAMVVSKPIPVGMRKAAESPRFIGKGNCTEAVGNNSGNAKTGSEKFRKHPYVFTGTGIEKTKLMSIWILSLSKGEEDGSVERAIHWDLEHLYLPDSIGKEEAERSSAMMRTKPIPVYKWKITEPSWWKSGKETEGKLLVTVTELQRLVREIRNIRSNGRHNQKSWSQEKEKWRCHGKRKANHVLRDRKKQRNY